MITLQGMAVFNSIKWFISGLVDLKNQSLLISFSSSSFLIYHIATHNIGLGSFNEDIYFIAQMCTREDQGKAGLSQQSTGPCQGNGMAANFKKKRSHC